MSTLIVYSGTADGYVESTAEANYASARSGSNLSASTGGTDGHSGQRYDTDGETFFTYYVDELFLGFDTSAIPDGDTVSAATLNLTSNGDNSNTDFTIEARLYDWGGTLTTADFVPGADLSGDTLLASYATSSGWTSGTGYDFSSESAFVSNVNKTGTTYLCLSSSRTRGNNSPSGDEYVRVRTADYTGTTSDPKLTIEYTAGGVTPALSIRLIRP